ncbi:hypothetical protein BG004_003798 [Podila humilis]|nr:hypothetical protein BG004_003798 [Podila humilis]
MDNSADTDTSAGHSREDRDAPMKAVLDRPHIVHAIASYFTERDFVTLLQVNRALHDVFSPFVWKAVKIVSTSGSLAISRKRLVPLDIASAGYSFLWHRSYDIKTYKPKEMSHGMLGLLRYRHLVKSVQTNIDLTLFLPYVMESVEAQFPNLDTLRVNGDSGLSKPRLRKLVQTHPGIHTLVLTGTPEAMSEWTDILSSHQGVKYVQFKSTSPWTATALLKIILACTNMYTLCLERAYDDASHQALSSTEIIEESKGTVQLAASLEQLPETPWRQLLLNLGCEILEYYCAAVMVAKSPKLRCLYLGLSDATNVLPPNLCSSLRESWSRGSLTNLALRVGSHSSRIAASLRTEDGVEDDHDNHHHHHLQSIELRFNINDGSGLNAGYRLSPNCLHSRTLFRLTIGQGLTIETLVDIAVECTQLRVIKVAIPLPDSATWTDEELMHMYSKQWQLPKLEKLSLRVVDNDDDDDMMTRRKLMEYMTLQIGKSSTLQYLRLDSVFKYRHLTHAFVNLMGLKKLKVANLFQAGPALEALEARFITENWDALSAIRNTNVSAQAKAILLEWRPWLFM